jgi:RND family efflux transporter MFP subunit
MEDFQLRQVKTNLDQLEVEYKRMETLKNRGSVTSQQYEQVSTQFQALKVQYEQLKGSVELRAPFSGPIIGKYINEGERYLSAPGYDGTIGVLSIAQLGRMKIEVMVPEQDFVHLRVGQPANVKIDAYPNQVFEGKIFTINPSLNRISRTSRVIIEMGNDKRLLKPGMFARVEIVTTGLKDVLAVPSTAVVKRDGETYVFTVENHDAPFDTTPKLVKVRTGLITNDYTQILDGLGEGAVVLTDNNVSLLEKTGIRVTEVK